MLEGETERGRKRERRGRVREIVIGFKVLKLESDGP